MRRRGLFPETPGGNFAEAERVPPEVEHGLIESEDSALGDAFRSWNEGGETRIDLGALGAVGAGEKVPEGQSIVRAGFGKNRGEGDAAGG